MDGPEKPDTRPQKTTYAGLRRQRLLGLGSEASVVGFVWVGSILGGAGIGYLLDSHFHTSFWTPLLLLVGAVMGFREMLMTISSLGKNAQPKHSFNSAAPQSKTEPKPETVATSDTTVATQPTRPRIFQVPPPPEASFMRRGEKAQQGTTQVSSENSSGSITNGSATNDPKQSGAASSSEELIRQLLEDDTSASQ